MTSWLLVDEDDEEEELETTLLLEEDVVEDEVVVCDDEVDEVAEVVELCVEVNVDTADDVAVVELLVVLGGLVAR